MKKYLLGAAALLAMAAPGIAHADNGSVGINYSNYSASGGGGSDVDIYGLNLSYDHEMSGGLVVQGDAQSDRLDAGGHIGLGYAAASLGTRSDTYSFYGWLGHTDLFIAGDAFNIGAGGGLYGSNYTLNGSIGYGDYDVGGVTNASVDGTWFFSDDFGVTGQIGYEDFDGTNATTYGVGVDWRFTGSPADIKVGYQRVDTDFGDLDVWKVGLSWQFGTDSARAASQNEFDGARRQFEDVLGGIF